MAEGDNNDSGPTPSNQAVAKELAKLIANMEKMTASMAKNFKSIAGDTKKTKDWTEDSNKSHQKIVEALTNQASVYQQVASEATNMQDRADMFLGAAQARVTLAERELTLYQDQIIELTKAGELDAEAQAAALERARLHQQEIKAEKAKLLHLEAAAGLHGNIATTLKNVAGLSKNLGFSGQFAAMAAEGGSLISVIKGVASEFNGLEVAAQSLDSMQASATQGMLILMKSAWEQAKAVDNAQAAMAKATGGMREYDGMIRDVYESNTLYGVSAEEAGEATQALFSSASQFTRQSKAQQAALVNSASLMSQAGVSARNYADGLEVSMMALGRTADEARRTQEDLLMFSRELGMSPEMMAESFAKAGPVMAKFSYNAERQFRDVAKAAKATGMEISRIMDYTQQFDTFEGAADKVGSLNAMLGGDFVNAMDLMAAENPAERMQMITDAIHDAGKSFEEMSYYEKMALAEAGGFADVQELSQAMKGDLDELNVSTAERALREEELQAIAAENQSTQEKMAATMAAMAPALNGFMESTRKLMEIIAPLAPYLHYAIFALGALKAVLFAVQVKTALATLGIGAKTAAQQMNTVATFQSIAADGTKTTSTITLTQAENLNTASTLRGTIAAKASSMWKAIGTAKNWLQTASLASLTGATGTATVATGGLTAATGTLGAVIMATPIGWIIAGVMLLIGAVYLLVTHFDKVKEVVSKVFGGIVKGISFVINAWISMINVMIRAANLVPFVNIPLVQKIGQSNTEVPALARGAHSFGGGPALVGEEGPEMVTLPPNSSVAPAKTTSPAVRQARSMAKGTTGGASPAAAAAQPVNVNITLELDKKVLAKHTEEVMIKKLNPAMA